MAEWQELEEGGGQLQLQHLRRNSPTQSSINTAALSTSAAAVRGLDCIVEAVFPYLIKKNKIK